MHQGRLARHGPPPIHDLYDFNEPKDTLSPDGPSESGDESPPSGTAVSARSSTWRAVDILDRLLPRPENLSLIELRGRVVRGEMEKKAREGEGEREARQAFLRYLLVLACCTVSTVLALRLVYL